MQFSRLTLKTDQPDRQGDFYRTFLGMRTLGRHHPPLCLGFDEAQCGLTFQPVARGDTLQSRDDLYWKIGLTLKDLDHAVDWLRSQNWPVSEPSQFGDIGYMAHLKDPGGFTIELLQQGFEGKATPAGSGHPIGGQAILAHVTLRITDYPSAHAYCTNRLGLRLMSVQPVADYGFDLYFYGWSDEPLPEDDLRSVANREWLWARPYTLLELQHIKGPDRSIRLPDAESVGFDALDWRDQDGHENLFSINNLIGD